MIGIFGIVLRSGDEAKTAARQMVKHMCHKQEWESWLHAEKNCAIGRVGYANEKNHWQAENGRYTAVLDGYARQSLTRTELTSETISVARMAQSYLQNGPSTFERFQGEFLFVLIDHHANSLHIAADCFGIRTAYWYRDGDRCVVTSSLSAALKSNLIKPELNEPFVAALLRFNKCRLGDDTIFTGVKVVPAGTVLICQNGTVQSTRYYEYIPYADERKAEEWVEIITQSIRDSVSQAISLYDTMALALTGGLDSRTVLAAIPANERERIFAITCGIPDSDEVHLAARTAASAGLVHHTVALDAKAFLTWGPVSVQRNEEFDIFPQGVLGALSHRAVNSGAKAIITGWDVDIPLRGTYLNDQAMKLANNADIFALVDAKWGLFNRSELKNLLKPEKYHEIGDAAADWLKNLINGLPADNPLDRYLLFIFQYEKRRLLMMRNRMLRFELETMTPFYDHDLQLLLARIPENLKRDNRLFVEVLRRLNTSLMRIPYSRTMLPADIPVEYWAQGMRLEAEKEAFYRQIFIETGHLIPLTRYYSNFDEWILCDPDWDALIQQLLLSKESYLTQTLVKTSAVENLVLTHRTGHKSHHSQIIYLLSLEMYLRTYFG